VGGSAGAVGGACTHIPRYSIYLLYYKSIYTEAVEERLLEAALVEWGACTHAPRYSISLLYWYKSTHTDADAWCR
jgi:hypothetical protein